MLARFLSVPLSRFILNNASIIPSDAFTSRNDDDERENLLPRTNFALFSSNADINRWTIMETRLERGSRLVKFTMPKLDVDWRRWNERETEGEGEGKREREGEGERKRTWAR